MCAIPLKNGLLAKGIHPYRKRSLFQQLVAAYNFMAGGGIVRPSLLSCWNRSGLSAHRFCTCCHNHCGFIRAAALQCQEAFLVVVHHVGCFLPFSMSLMVQIYIYGERMWRERRREGEGGRKIWRAVWRKGRKDSESAHERKRDGG